MGERGVDSPLVDIALARFEKLFGHMEAQLAKAARLAGDTCSPADIGPAACVLPEHLKLMADGGALPWPAIARKLDARWCVSAAPGTTTGGQAYSALSIA